MKKPIRGVEARFWTKIFALDFAIGAATGIVMSISACDLLKKSHLEFARYSFDGGLVLATLVDPAFSSFPRPAVVASGNR